MATNRIQLTVDTPCQQRWQDMPPIETGRFCDHCQKTVVDFSGLTDRQLIDLLAQAPSSTCGRFRHNQLNRTIQVSVPATSSPKRFFSLLTAGLLGYQTVRAETPPALAVPPTTQIYQRSTNTPDQPASNETASTDSLRVITGRVIDSASNTSFEGVYIIIKGTDRGAKTDSAGHFQLTLPSETKNSLITLIVGSIGFITQEIQVTPNRSGPLSIVLKEDSAALNEVIVVGTYKKQ